MSDEEVEKFEISDYDLDNEFNINRPRRRLTKHQQIYGIWAHDSGDEGNGSKSHQRASHRKNYSAPVSFVSGGVQQAGKKDEAKGKTGSDDEDDDDDDDDDDDESAPGTSRSRRIAATSSEESEDDAKYSKQKLTKQDLNYEGEMAGFRKKRFMNPGLIEKGVGDWEKHTKGIGAKLLLQMGFQPGKGLGKDLQGISAPVEAYQRKGRGSIGAYGPEKGTAKKPDTDEEADKEFVEKLSLWRRDDSDKKKKTRYVYKSVDEVIEQGKLKPGKKDYSQLSKVKVIDMTGPQQRVLSGYHAIAGQQRPSEEWEVRKDKKFSNFALPELQHNLNILMDMCEQEIIENDRRLRYINDRKITLEQEASTLKTGVDQEGKQIKSLENVLAIIENMVERSNDRLDPLTLDRAAEFFKEIQEDYYEEYMLYDIGSLAIQIVAPLLKEKLVSWNPLENASGPLGLFKQWKDILEVDSNSSLTGGSSQDPYHKLLWETWMPNVRIAINNWNCRACEPLIELLEHWLPLIPLWILENIREQLVLPRMQHEVEEWNPMTDTVPIHAWIHPWIPLLGGRLETTVYPVIRHKLSKALVNWHPSDRSAKLMLEPWHKVFARGDMDAFLVKNILPKLQLCLQEFVINPHEQHLDHWNWVMDWEGLLPVFSLAGLLERFFFPNWLQVLTMWLNSNPNYDAICTWYMGWKGMFSEALLAQPGIKEQFRKALDIMNRAVLQPGQMISQPPGAMETVSYLTNLEQVTQSPQSSRDRESRYESLAEAVRIANQVPQGFKELVQKHCEERGIVFVPIANRYCEGKQVYRCGKIQVYIDRNVVFISENGTVWRPTSLNAMLDMAMRAIQTRVGST
ncbi:Septin-interacting protein 1 [Gryllus bimaculatus]|nr:Septin-interacting protein 1 [Gryllus bimaculatus]